MVSTIIFISSVVIFGSSMLYYMNRLTYYRNDERGLSIIAKSAMITFSSLLGLFALFLIYVTSLDIFGFPNNQLYSIVFIRNLISIAVAVISTINALSIYYLSRD